MRSYDCIGTCPAAAADIPMPRRPRVDPSSGVAHEIRHAAPSICSIGRSHQKSRTPVGSLSRTRNTREQVSMGRYDKGGTSFDGERACLYGLWRSPVSL